MTEKPAAIMASLVDVRNIAAHRCVRLEIHVPVEQAALVMQAFGWPTMADPVPVAIARLVPEAEAKAKEPAKEKRNFSELSPSQRAGLMCKTPAFWTFTHTVDEESSATRLRQACKVDSRSQLDNWDNARRAFESIERDYQAWLNEPIV